MKNKKLWKYISVSAILIFMILWIARLFSIGEEYISMDFQNIFVIIYLITELQHNRILVREKNAKIRELEMKLQKNK